MNGRMKIPNEQFAFHEMVALVADRTTATFYRLAGLTNVFSVDSREEAEQRIHELSKASNYLIILITEPIARELQDVLERLADEKYPLYIPIPDVEERMTAKIDLISNLIKRKAGIEFKLE